MKLPLPTRLLTLCQPYLRFANAVGLVIYIVQRITRFNLANILPLEPRLDAAGFFSQSIRIWNEGYYPFETFHTVIGMSLLFPYPPSAIFLFKGLSSMGPSAFALVWPALLTVSLIVMLRMSLAGDKLNFPHVWLGVGLAALLIADGPVMWDLHHQNSNLLYIALVLAGFGLISSYAAIAGILLGLSVSLKVLSGLIFVWLLIFGPRRALVSGAATLMVLWFVLPLLVFGFDGTVSLYFGWLDQLKVAANKFELIPNYEPRGSGWNVWIVDARTTAMILTGAGPADRMTQYVAWGMQSIWACLLLIYLAVVFRSRSPAAPSRAALADWIILMLAPLPFSPLLEFYHPVAMVPAAMLLVVIVLDKEAARRDRLVALATITILLLDRFASPYPQSLRGLDLFVRMAVIGVAFVLLRPSMPDRTWPKPHTELKSRLATA